MSLCRSFCPHLLTEISLKGRNNLSYLFISAWIHQCAFYLGAITLYYIHNIHFIGEWYLETKFWVLNRMSLLQVPLREYMHVSVSSVQLSQSVMSNSLRPHEAQHTRPHCPSPTPGVHPNIYPLSQWCHPTISSSVVPFSSCPQSFPASESFPMTQLFTSCGQSIGVSALASVPPMNTQDWSPLEWTGWICFQSKGLSRVIPKPQFKSINSSVLSFLYSPTLTSTHDHWKNHSLD